jgi:hypothetical protein
MSYHFDEISDEVLLAKDFNVSKLIVSWLIKFYWYPNVYIFRGFFYYLIYVVFFGV